MMKWLPSNISYQEATEIQKEISKKVNLNSPFKSISDISIVIGCDAILKENKKKDVIVGTVVMKFPSLELIEKIIKRVRMRNIFPYKPGFLSFREGPALMKVLHPLIPKYNSSVILFDGHGISHPRKAGLATHLGFLLDVPTLGCAKNLLIGEYRRLGNRRGCFSYIFYNGEKVGITLRTKENVKPVFVSPGYKISFDISKELVLACCKGFRLPEPLRLAHQISTHG